MEHIKKKLAVIVVFFAVFIGIVTIWTVRKPSQPKLTAVTWKLEEEADLDGNELSSYAKDPSKSKVVLTFKKDQTYRCKNLENKKIWKGTYTLSRTKSKDTYMLHLVPDQGTASYYGVYGTREYEDGTGHMSVIPCRIRQRQQFRLFLLLSAELCGCHAGKFFKHHDKMAGICITDIVCDLLNFAVTAHKQQFFCLGDPVVC